MTERLPTVGDDAGTWGTVLNGFLGVAHRADGNLKGAGAVYNILDYGALGDGTTDDSTSIQAAIDACAAAGGGRVYVPAILGAAKSATGAASTDLFTSTAHGFVVGDEVFFTAVTGGTGITVGQTYYVIAAGLTANAFQISNVRAGTTINFTSDVSASTLKRRSFYSCGGLELKTNVALVGDGAGSILKQRSASTYLLSVNSGSQGTADPYDNKRDIAVASLQLLATVLADGFLQGNHLLNVNACSDLLVYDVSFVGSRSDGIYFGSSNTASTERHNESCKVLFCTFDGINKDNRNAISVIDGSDILIQGCTIRNFSRTDMPGAIDIEPNNNAFARMRDIRVLDNHIENCGGNVAQITFDCTPTQATLTIPTQRIIIAGNTIRNCTNSAAGIFLRHHQTPSTTTVRNHIEVLDNIIDVPGTASGVYGMEIDGCRGVKVSRNTISNTPAGALSFGYEYRTMDVSVLDNTFYKNGTVGGTVIAILAMDRLLIHRNVFDTIGDQAGTGRITSFDYNAGNPSTSSGIELVQNRVLGAGATTVSSKNASHTVSLTTSRYNQNLFGSLTPDATHWGLLSDRARTLTVATLPTASDYPGAIVYVSDGTSGNKFRGSDGSSWINLG